MKWLFRLAGLLIAGILVFSGFSSAIQPHSGTGTYHLHADTDTVYQKIVLVEGDSISGFVEDGQTVQLFIGDVRGVQDSTEV